MPVTPVLNGPSLTQIILGDEPDDTIRNASAIAVYPAARVLVVHHIPREHWGIRHEPRGSFASLEDRLATDPAIKDADIGNVIAEPLEQEGKVVPWGLLAVPVDTLTPSVIEHAVLIARAAKRQTAEGAPTDPGEDPEAGLEPRRVAMAREVLKYLPTALERAGAAGREDLASAYERFLADG